LQSTISEVRFAGLRWLVAGDTVSVAAHDVTAEAWAIAPALVALVGSQRHALHPVYSRRRMYSRWGRAAVLGGDFGAAPWSAAGGVRGRGCPEYEDQGTGNEGENAHRRSAPRGLTGPFPRGSPPDNALEPSEVRASRQAREGAQASHSRRSRCGILNQGNSSSCRELYIRDRLIHPLFRCGSSPEAL
jgi:hypothetical protein